MWLGLWNSRTYPWSQSDSNDPSETVENKTANEAIISNACSESIFVTNLIDMYPLYRLFEMNKCYFLCFKSWTKFWKHKSLRFFQCLIIKWQNEHFIMKSIILQMLDKIIPLHLLSSQNSSKSKNEFHQIDRKKRLQSNTKQEENIA